MKHIDTFNQLAARYDTPNNKKMSKLATEAIRRFLDKKSTNKAADLGCGTGLIGLELLKDVDAMLFVDASEKMLEQVELKLKDQPTDKAEVLRMDIDKNLQLPYKVDTIILSLVLHHIPNYQTLLTNLYDQLTDNGQLLIIEMEKQAHGHGFEQTELTSELSRLGYQHIQSEIFYDAKKESDTQNTSRFILSAQKI